MTIKDLYKQAKLSKDDFQGQTGVEQSEFNILLKNFVLDIPKKLTLEERLFAILYVEQHGIENKVIGALLNYVNAVRDGTTFVEKARLALDKARSRARKHLAPGQLDTHVDENESEQDDVLDRKDIQGRIDNIFAVLPLFESDRSDPYSNWMSWRDYYNLCESLTEDEIKSVKWRTYIYLRKCVLDYRAGETKELDAVIDFLESSTQNRQWLAQRLLDKAVRCKDEYWGSGSHEWLERSLIVDVLKRSAGMVDGVESETGVGCVFADFDWLYVQANIRTPTKYILFKNKESTIENGHIGSVKPNLDDPRRFSTEGSSTFHKSLHDAFMDSADNRRVFN